MPNPALERLPLQLGTQEFGIGEAIQGGLSHPELLLIKII
jgi:hypothetical protein